MFGASSTSSPFGGANNNNAGGGLFGSKPAASGSSGFGGFGSNNNTSNAANTSSGSLFGNSNTNNATSGGLFGSNNNNNTTQPQSSSLFGNKPAATGGFFGNNSATASPAPSGGLFGSNTAANTSSGGLFGNNSATASPAPSGGLFGNTASKPSLFGASSSTAAKPSLFGSNTTTQQPSTGLFGASSNSTPGGQSNNLFGNSSNNNQTFNPMMNTTPMKQYNFKDLPKSLTDSTKKTIPNSVANRKRSLSNTPSNSFPINGGRSTLMEKLGSRFSTLSSQAASYNSQGLFSPKKDFIQSTHAAEKGPELNRTAAKSHFYKPFASGSLTTRSVRAPRSTATDYLKLKVDQSRSDARRLKIFGENGGAKKVRILGQEDHENGLTIRETEESVEMNGTPTVAAFELATPRKTNGHSEAVEEPVVPPTYDNDYWCSPSIEELQQLPLRQLSEISGFTIGRKGFGVIRFELPVDLTGLWSDLPGLLFGKVVRFAKKGTVEVYPHEHVPLGSGLNVPATITLDKVFPVSKNKKTATDPTSKDMEYRLFVKRLRELKDMEFITYDPINGSWTFKVKHFSIWGLVDEDDAVVDVDEALEKLKQKKEASPAPASDVSASNAPVPQSAAIIPTRRLLKSNNPTEDTFIYKKQKQDNSFEFDTTAFMPGSFITEDIYEQARQLHETKPAVDVPRTLDILAEIDSDDDILEEAEVPLGLVKHGDESFMEDDYGIVERQFEPENLDDTDFEVLDADPKLAVSDDWDRQLEISARFDSAFANSGLKTTTIHDAPFSKAFTPGDLDKLLYGDFEKVVKSRNAIKKELKLDGYKFAQLSTSNRVLVQSSKTSSHIAAKSLRSFYSSEADASVFKKHIAYSKIVERRNGFPVVSKNDRLNFKLVTDSLEGHSTSEKTVWELASVLFDSNVNNTLNGVSDLDVINRVFEIQRREGLIAWIKKEVQSEIDTQLENHTDPFEQIYLLLTGFNISNAAKLAIKTNNPHLAVLISLLGSNDPDVRLSASKQLEEWKKNAMLPSIPEGLVKIYHLLKGDVLTTTSTVQIDEDLSWKAKLGLLLCYGDLNESLAELLSSFIDAEAATVPKTDLTYFNLLKLYVHRHVSSYSLNDIFSCLKTDGALDVKLQWYVYEILIRSTKQMTFGENAEFGDRLTLSFAEQLQTCGMWVEAVFTMAHLVSDDACKRAIQQLLTSQSGLLSHDSFIREVQDVLKVPASVVSEAKALYYRYTGAHWEEASCLLDAERFEEAHRSIVNYVAPAAVINNGSKLAQLEKLIVRFPERRHIADWSIGLAIYKNYLKLISSKSTPEAPLRYLVENIPLMKQSNFKVKVATKLISKRVAVKLSELQIREGNAVLDLHVDKTAKLPLGESERSLVGMLQNYLKKESLTV